MRMKFSIEDVIQSIHKYPITMIAIDVKGDIKHYTSLTKIPKSTKKFASLINLNENKGCAVSFLSQDKEFSTKRLSRKIKESIEALRYDETHDLKPGVNIPGNKKYYSIKKKLAKKLGMKE